MYGSGPRFLCRPTALCILLEPWGVGELCIRRAADLLLQLWVGTFPCFVAVGFYFLSETNMWVASPIIFLFIRGHLALGGWCCAPLQHDFALDPVVPPFDFHFDFFLNICHLTSRELRLPQCIMGDDLHIYDLTLSKMRG